jgi:hypothetical protein
MAEEMQELKRVYFNSINNDSNNNKHKKKKLIN